MIPGESDTSAAPESGEEARRGAPGGTRPHGGGRSANEEVRKEGGEGEEGKGRKRGGGASPLLHLLPVFLLHLHLLLLLHLILLLSLLLYLLHLLLFPLPPFPQLLLLL